MTTEQKAKAYDEVREKIALRFGSNVAEEIFSEFEMSEDEKVRDEIVLYIGAKDDISLDTHNKWLSWLEKQGKERKITHEEICKSYGIPDIGEFSDGYHTFNGLYKQRMILFAVLVKTYKDRAWKSWKHEDGLNCFGGGWFIVGIDTPVGTYTYHYEAKDWDRFDCQILEKAKHWDGHDEFDVERLFSLVSNANKDEVVRCLINGMKFYYEDNKEAIWGTEKFSMKVKDILSWLEKQGEQKPANKVEPKFKVKYAGSEYNVLEVKDTAGVTYYGIEDEPNHIDYVQAKNCERVGGYSIKESWSPFPTKPAKFSEQKPTWSEEDENGLGDALWCCKQAASIAKDENDMGNAWYAEHWLKSLKQRYVWKPSEEQISALDFAIDCTVYPELQDKEKVLIELLEQLKQL